VDTETISRNKVILIGLFLLALVAIPVTIFMVTQRQQTTTKASETGENEIVAIVNGEKISKAQARRVALEQNSPKGVGTEALKSAVDEIAQRKAVDKIASASNISATNAEVAKEVKDTGAPREEAKYAVLKQKLTESQVKNWQVESIRFWIPADEPVEVSGTTIYKTPSDLTTEEANVRQDQLKEATKYLSEAETLLKTSDALSVAQSLSTKYPELTKIIAVNNNLLSEYSPSSSFANEYKSPAVYTADELANDLYANQIRALKNPGEVVKVRSDHNGGGAVFKLVAVNQSAPYATYDELLQQEIAKLGVLNNLNK
jgi:hypothetical protein